MKEIYFVRHGESVANATNRYAGQFDSPLTKKGIEQAHESVNNFKNIEINKIISSTLSRAFNTAKIIRDAKYKDLEIEK